MTADEIIEDVADLYEIHPCEIEGRSLRRYVVCARQEVMARMHERGMSLGQIGRRLGGLHHTTVLHGVRRHHERNEVGA